MDKEYLQQIADHYQQKSNHMARIIAMLIVAAYKEKNVPFPDDSAGMCGTIGASLSVYLYTVFKDLPVELSLLLHQKDLAQSILIEMNAIRNNQVVDDCDHE